MISRKFEIDIDSNFGNTLWLFLKVLMDKFPDSIKEMEPEHGSAEELLTKPIFGRKVKEE